MARHRRALTAAVLVAVIGLAAVAWLVGSRVQSSSQAAARAEPPTPSAITAAVERRVLNATVIRRADVVPAGSVAVSGPTLDAEAGAGSQIVTGVFVARGDEVTAGMRLVEVAGRPVFAFQGATPAFRTMRPGMSGADVAQLQTGLVAAGCPAGDTGSYDAATKLCVDWLYVQAGYDATRSSPSEEADLEAARTAVVEAEDALATAENALASTSGASDGAVSAAQAAVNDAQRTYDAAVAQRPTLIDTATRQANDAIGSAAGALHAAQAALAGAHADPAAGQAAVAAAQAAVDDAQRAYDAAVAQRPTLIDTATRQADDAIASAADALDAARAAMGDATADPDVSAQQLAVEQQQRTVDRTRQALTELEEASGAIVPFGEIAFVPQLPGRVDAVNAVVGGAATGADDAGPLVVIATPVLEARLSIAQTDADLVQVGTPVELLAESTGETVTGTVSSIAAELATTDASAIPAYPAVVDAALPENWSGLNVRATFTGASTQEAVLVVPVAAVSSAANGQTRVQVQRSDGTIDTVTVTTGLSADGFVEVTPEESGRLAADDRVVVGQ